MKQLKVYMESGEYVIERVNEFNHATKRFFITKNALFEGLEVYQEVIDQYDLQVSEDLWATVINFLNGGFRA